MSRILVVDDDRDICALVRFKLEQQGHEVLLAHDGDAGLAMAIDADPDLVVLDWMTPRRTGIEVCSALRAHADRSRVPIILLTAKVQEADVERGFAAGADDYIVKPFSPRELARRIDAVLERTLR